jgi:hypothetical protein
MLNEKMMLQELDNDTLIEWGRAMDEIKRFISNHIDNKDNAEHLLGLICDYERLSRQRTRVYAARWLLREDCTKDD